MTFILLFFSPIDNNYVCHRISVDYGQSHNEYSGHHDHNWAELQCTMKMTCLSLRFQEDIKAAGRKLKEISYVSYSQAQCKLPLISGSFGPLLTVYFAVQVYPWL